MCSRTSIRQLSTIKCFTLLLLLFDKWISYLLWSLSSPLYGHIHSCIHIVSSHSAMMIWSMAQVRFDLYIVFGIYCLLYCSCQSFIHSKRRNNREKYMNEWYRWRHFIGFLSECDLVWTFLFFSHTNWMLPKISILFIFCRFEQIIFHSIQCLKLCLSVSSTKEIAYVIKWK